MQQILIYKTWGINIDPSPSINIAARTDPKKIIENYTTEKKNRKFFLAKFYTSIRKNIFIC
jgi:hypothetical protein